MNTINVSKFEFKYVIATDLEDLTGKLNKINAISIIKLYDEGDVIKCVVTVKK